MQHGLYAVGYNIEEDKLIDGRTVVYTPLERDLQMAESFIPEEIRKKYKG